MAWGVLFLGETVSRGMLLGFGCILVSVLLVNDVHAPRAVLIRAVQMRAVVARCCIPLIIWHGCVD